MLCLQATVEIDELAKFASEAGEKMKNLEPVTSDADAIVEQLNHYKVSSSCLQHLAGATSQQDYGLAHTKR